VNSGISFRDVDDSAVNIVLCNIIITYKVNRFLSAPMQVSNCLQGEKTFTVQDCYI